MRLDYCDTSLKKIAWKEERKKQMLRKSILFWYISGIFLANFAERIQPTEIQALAPEENKVDSWSKCAGRVCKNLMARQVTQSSCIFGCRAAMHGSLKSLVIFDARYTYDSRS